jgi:putative ABC transport system permease protein
VTLLDHLRHSIRSLLRTPAFTLTVVLTLALGIGANAAVFSAVDAILLRPLAFPDGDRLVRLGEVVDAIGETRGVAPVRIEDWSRLSSTILAIAGYTVEDVSDTTWAVPERLRRATVTPGFLEALAVAPALGRDFTDAEHRLSGPPSVLISDRYWRTRFGAAADVLGRTVRIGDHDRSYTIVGVMPASFGFPDRDTDWWVAEWLDAPWMQGRRGQWYTSIGRLKPDVTLAQARADLEAVQARLGEQYPDTDRAIRPSIVPLKDRIVAGARGSLWLLFGSVAVLLLIACSNIAALLFARGAQREHEIAVRVSLGATRRTVLAQLLTEAFVLAFCGAAIGLLAAASGAALFGILTPDLPRLDEVSIDARVLLYTAGVAVLVTLLCGLSPALGSARRKGPILRESRVQVSPRHPLQWLFVGVQVALSVALLTTAGLLLRSIDELGRVEAGFERERVLTFRVSGAFGEDTPERIVQRINRTLAELDALPGVEAAATALQMPGVGQGFQNELAIGAENAEPAVVAELRAVAPSYFDTLQIPLLRGEPCRAQEGTTELVVNRTFADRYLPARSAVGTELFGGVSGRIVGVVGDTRELAIDRNPVAAVYACAVVPHPFPWYLVRTGGDAMVGADTIRRKINELEPLRAVYDILPLAERIDEAYAQNRLRTILLSLFAATALSLTCLGVYGTLSYIVRLRRREVGLRVALGALSRRIVAQLLKRALGVVVLACAVGVLMSLALRRVLSGLLYGVSPSDPVTLSGVVAIVLAVAVSAALLPAVRASRIDPMTALRDD